MSVCGSQGSYSLVAGRIGGRFWLPDISKSQVCRIDTLHHQALKKGGERAPSHEAVSWASFDDFPLSEAVAAAGPAFTKSTCLSHRGSLGLLSPHLSLLPIALPVPLGLSPLHRAWYPLSRRGITGLISCCLLKLMVTLSFFSYPLGWKSQGIGFILLLSH